jgi:hypothetical protein
MMSIDLPPLVDLYVKIENSGEVEALSGCFAAANATVRDEGQTYGGLAAIKEWRAETKKKYNHTIRPLEITHRDGKTVLKAGLTGSFPGSPVTVKFSFVLESGKIPAGHANSSVIRLVKGGLGGRARMHYMPGDFTAPIAPQGLHGGVIDDFHGAAECPREIEPNPSVPEIVRFSDRSATEHGARIADRHSVVGPICRELLHAGDHLFGLLPLGSSLLRWLKVTSILKYFCRSSNRHAHVEEFPQRAQLRNCETLST